MKSLKKVATDAAMVAQEYTVVYYNETIKETSVKTLTVPEITITVGDSTDTAVLPLTCTKNATVKGDVVWTCNLPSETATIEGSNLAFTKHYNGNVTLTATADNCSATKTINICKHSKKYTLYYHTYIL